MRQGIAALIVATVILNVADDVAAQSEKTPRIGYVSAAAAADVADRTEAFRGGLRELGYIEGKNIVIEWRYADGKFDRLPVYMADLVRVNVNIIVSTGPLATRAAKEATATIPIVMTNDSDPVGMGFIASLARPGGNITGLSNLAHDLSAKRLELLKETVPKLARVAILGDTNVPGNAQSLKDIQQAAAAFGIQAKFIELNDPNDIDKKIRAARQGRADGVLVLNGPPHIQRRIPSLAVKYRLPAIYFNSVTVNDGGLMSYGTNIADLDRRAAVYVDKILKGTKPADIPVEQPMKFEFVINLKTAKQIGITIPQWTLMKADRVIK